jgi:hypothetical protein
MTETLSLSRRKVAVKISFSFAYLLVFPLCSPHSLELRLAVGMLPFASCCWSWVASEFRGMALRFVAEVGERVAGAEFLLSALGF